ncbi:MAG: MarR family winged helix-turn-helix transcriptional regulator [Pseudomonadota bacterium]
MTVIEPDRIGQILMLMDRDFQERLAQDLTQRGVRGVSRRHRSVFLYLGQHGASRSVDLAQAAGIRPQSMMTIVNELEELGMVKRRPDPNDSRAKLIEFTAVGRQFIDELRQSTQAVYQQYADLVGEKQMQSVFKQLNRLVTAT